MSIDLLLVCFQALYCGLVLFLFSELLFWEHGIECRYAVCPFLCSNKERRAIYEIGNRSKYGKWRI